MNDFINKFYKAMGSSRVAVGTQQEEQAKPKPTSAVESFLSKGRQQTQEKEQQPIDVDWDFIEQLEGNALKGYVPTNSKNNTIYGQSGVTIGAGFDLGQHSLEDLNKMGLSPELTAKLTPYLGKKKNDAVEALRKQPLRLTKEEVAAINPKVRETALQRLVKSYNTQSKTPFENLTKEQKTILASVAFQYGDLSSRTPNFWKNVISGNWDLAHNNLLNFGDAYTTRRLKEANYLAGTTEV